MTTTETGDEWAVVLGRRVRRARERANLTQQALADSAAISKVWVSRIERGKVARPGAKVLDQIAQVLGGDVIPPLRGLPSQGEPGFNVVARVDGDLRAREARLLPVYRWGSAGDPRDVESSPDPDHEEYPPLGKESLIGNNGFGVLIRGESMAGREIHDGDTVWINPDRPYRVGRPVLARLWDDTGEVGMVVKTLRRNEEGDLRLYSEQEGPAICYPVDCARYEVVGPVVGISPAFRLPG